MSSIPRSERDYIFPHELLTLLGWRSRIDECGLRNERLVCPEGGYGLLLRDVVELNRKEREYADTHGALPYVSAGRG